MKWIAFPAATLALIVNAACAPATPTVDPAQIQASAMAAANTMVAMTQAAMPTATEIPPTPVPSPTPLPSPTLADLPTVSFDALPTAAPTAGDCRHLFDLASTGKARAKVLIQNATKGPITVSIGLSEKNAFGQCGYLSWGPISKLSNITVSVPQTGLGPCYWAYAFVNDPKHQTQVANPFPFCMNNPDKWVMTITYDTIRLTPP
jgi:hypothetical protein